MGRPGARPLFEAVAGPAPGPGAAGGLYPCHSVTAQGTTVHGAGSQEIWTVLPTRSLISSGTLGKLYPFSGPQFPLL